MEEKEFYDLVKEVEGLYHVEVTPPNYEDDYMTIRFLDGPLKMADIRVEAHMFTE